MTFYSARCHRPDVGCTRSSRQNMHPSECSPFYIFPHVHSLPSVSARRRFSPPPSAHPCLLFTPFAVTLSFISERRYCPFNTCVLLQESDTLERLVPADDVPQTTSRNRRPADNSLVTVLRRRNYPSMIRSFQSPSRRLASKDKRLCLYRARLFLLRELDKWG